MGWYISHGGTPNGTYTYTGMSDLFARLKKVASWGQRRTLKPLMERRTEAFFTVEPRTAADIGATLIDLSLFLPGGNGDDDWHGMAVQIGESALRAASANEQWRWS